MKTFSVKCKISKEDSEYLWSCSDEFCDYYNSMLNTLRIDYEIKSEWPLNCRSYISKYELQKQYSAKRLGFKPDFLMSWQIIGTSDQLFNSIKSFWELKKINKNAKFPFREKQYSKFNPLYFGFQKDSRNIKILNSNQIELGFQNKKKIVVRCKYNKKHDLTKMKLRPEGHKIIFKNDCFYFHFCIEEPKKEIISTNKSIYIDLGQKDLVTGYVKETKEIIKVSGKLLVNQALIRKKEVIQSLRDKKKHQSIKNKKLKRTLKRLQRKETNQKRTLLHKVSKNLVTNYDTIVVGDLKQIKENTKSWSKKTNKYKFQYWPVALFVDMIDYKSLSSSRKFYKINESYTTKKCCVCGNIQNVTLSERIYHCVNCGSVIPRDTNSAINIYDRFEQLEPKLFNSVDRSKRTELIGALKTSVLRVA